MVFLWVTLYGLVHTVAQSFEKISKLCSDSILLLYGFGLILWIIRSGRKNQIMLIPPRYFSREQKRTCIPLLLLPLANLLCVESVVFGLSPAIKLLVAAVVEEIFFRGFFLNAIKNRGKLQATLVVSLLFALMHVPDSIHRADIAYICLQVACAFGFSLCGCGTVFSCKSLLPSIISHVLINITSLISVHHISAASQVQIFWLCAAVQILIGIRLCFKYNSHSKE